MYFPPLSRIQIVYGWWPIATGLAVTASILGSTIVFFPLVSIGLKYFTKPGAYLPVLRRQSLRQPSD
ncbi:MAG: hypothetical protein WAN28_03905, partial [Terracidiphilus sp.]